MSRIAQDHAVWTAEETERLIEWLEEPENLRKIKKESGIRKKQIISEIVSKIPTKAPLKVGYKYDNLLKAYREAVKLNGQSGCGLTAKDLDIGKRVLRGMSSVNNQFIHIYKKKKGLN